MKKYLLYITPLILFIIGILIVVKPFKSSPLMDCLEFGVCKEGLSIFDNGKEVIITKQYCIEQKYKWDENTLTCNIRKQYREKFGTDEYPPPNQQNP